MSNMQTKEQLRITENRLLLQLEITKFAYCKESELINRRFRLFMFMNKVFCIDVKWIRRGKMSWSTYWINSSNRISNERQMSTSLGSSISIITNEILSNITDDQILGATNIWFGLHKFDKSVFNSNESEDTMILAKTEEQIKSANLERQIFKNPMMWKFKLQS